MLGKHFSRRIIYNYIASYLYWYHFLSREHTFSNMVNWGYTTKNNFFFQITENIKIENFPQQQQLKRVRKMTKMEHINIHKILSKSKNRPGKKHSSILERSIRVDLRSLNKNISYFRSSAINVEYLPNKKKKLISTLFLI